MIRISQGVSGGTRVYSTPADRERAVKMLRKRGNDYFVRFRDVQGCGLQFGVYAGK